MSNVIKNFDEFRARGLKLDMSRGKPSAEQLELSKELLGSLEGSLLARDGTDCRNYGALLGIAEAREFFAGILDVPPAQVVVGGNSSLSMMHDAMAFAFLHGFPAFRAWSRGERVRFLCPVPGYDRHFAICQHLGIEMVNVPLLEDGPDMNSVERLVESDPTIKGIWCVPKYGNPTGTIYSRKIAERLACMRTAAPDFRIFWDDAYRVHHLTAEEMESENIMRLCGDAGCPDRPLVFFSTSKVTFASAGVAVLAASERNVEWWRSHLCIQTIGPDKLNQLRHVNFFTKTTTLSAHMRRHRAVLEPRFDRVEDVFREMLSSLEGVHWTRPKGGYFVDLTTPPGLATATVDLARTAGLTLTPAGASFPYGRDPRDEHIRIAPSFPLLDEVELAARGIALALRQASVQRSSSGG